jgi:hypothetical protein
VDDKAGGAESVGVAGVFVGHDFGEGGDGVVEGAGEAVGGVGNGLVGGDGEGSIKGGSANQRERLRGVTPTAAAVWDLVWPLRRLWMAFCCLGESWCLLVIFL